MTSRAAPRKWSGGRVVEAAAAGLAYGAGLCWASVCLLASFRPRELSNPYWADIPHLRADTSGIVAFAVLAVCLCASEYLRLRRRSTAIARGIQADLIAKINTEEKWRWKIFVLAMSETVVVLSTGLVGYLSVNAVTHPGTLQLHLTHLLPWPAEGTVRVIALLLSVGSVAILRYLWPVVTSHHSYAAQQ